MISLFQTNYLIHRWVLSAAKIFTNRDNSGAGSSSNIEVLLILPCALLFEEPTRAAWRWRDGGVGAAIASQDDAHLDLTTPINQEHYSNIDHI